MAERLDIDVFFRVTDPGLCHYACAFRKSGFTSSITVKRYWYLLMVNILSAKVRVTVCYTSKSSIQYGDLDTSLQVSGAVAKFQGKSRPAYKSSDDILAKMWGSVRASNGIKALLSLLMVKTPLVDADCIRSLACKALCGLSRSDKIRQVIGKLQLFNSGQLQSK